MPIKKTYDVVRPEHDFTGTLQEWEERIFKEAVLFRVTRFGGHQVGNLNNRDEIVTEDFEQAVSEARKYPRTLLYVIAPSERFFCMERAQYDRYLKLHKEIKSER